MKEGGREGGRKGGRKGGREFEGEFFSPSRYGELEVVKVLVEEASASLAIK